MSDDDPRLVIKRFMDAWENGDAEAVMEVMAEDCAYLASVGPEPGTSYRGRDQVGAGVAEMLAFEAGGESRQGGVWLSGDHAFAEWDYDEIGEDGTVRAIRGLDVIRVVDGKIASIDAYRKCYE